MKKLLSFAAVCFFVLTLYSCSSETTPEDVTTKAINCIIDKDYEGYINMMLFQKEKSDEDKAQLAALVREKMDKEMEKKQGITDYEIGTATIKENSAIVPYKLTYGDGEIKEDSMKLIKNEKGEWMIDSGK